MDSPALNNLARYVEVYIMTKCACSYSGIESVPSTVILWSEIFYVIDIRYNEVTCTASPHRHYGTRGLSCASRTKYSDLEILTKYPLVQLRFEVSCQRVSVQIEFSVFLERA
jgi:hypothetical protein